MSSKKMVQLTDESVLSLLQESYIEANNSSRYVSELLEMYTKQIANLDDISKAGKVIADLIKIKNESTTKKMEIAKTLNLIMNKSGQQKEGLQKISETEREQLNQLIRSNIRGND